MFLVKENPENYAISERISFTGNLIDNNNRILKEWLIYQ